MNNYFIEDYTLNFNREVVLIFELDYMINVESWVEIDHTVKRDSVGEVIGLKEENVT